MINEIIKKYGEFSDSWISKVRKRNDSVILNITAANFLNEFKYEEIELIFDKIIEFNCIYSTTEKTIVIKDAFIKDEKGIIIFDNEPIDHFHYLEENHKSNFKIKSKSIEYKFIQFYKE